MKNILIAIAALAALALAPASHAGVVEMLPSATVVTQSATQAVASPEAFDISGISQAAIWATATNTGTAGSLVYRIQRSPDGTAWSSDYLQVTQSVSATSQAVSRLPIASDDLVGIEWLKLHSIISTTTAGVSSVSSVLLAH